MALITQDNVVPILGTIISGAGVYMLRDVLKYFRLWRHGASSRQREARSYVDAQLEKCNDELNQTQNERDMYRQQVGRRDYVILSHNLELPNDGGSR